MVVFKKEEKDYMKSLKSKLILFTASLIIILSVVTLGVGVFTSYHGIVKSVEEDLQANGHTADLAISSNIALLKGQIQSMCGLDYMSSDADVASKLNFLEEMKKANDFLSVSLINPNGIISSKDAAINGKTVSDETILHRALSGETVITEPDYNEKGDFVINLYSSTTDRKHIVMATVDGLFLADIVKGYKIGKTGNLFIVGKDGTTIADTDPNLVKEKNNFILVAQTDKKAESAAKVYKKMS